MAPILLARACLSVGITVEPEALTGRVPEALRDLTSPRALVIRDGMCQPIAGRDVGRGGVIVLAEGDRVPADAAPVDAQDQSADESVLTGEAAACKLASAATRRVDGRLSPMACSGSLIVRGTVVARVTPTGPRSEIGRIGTPPGRLETETPEF